MKKIIWGVVVIIVVGLVVFVGWRKQSQETAGTIKIGAVLPMTGDYASVTEEVNKGALIAVDEAKQNGLNVEYVAENDEFKPAGFINAAQKLLREDNVESAFTLAFPEVKPMAHIFNQAKVPLLAVWDSTDYIKTAGHYIFTIGFSTEEGGGKMAHYAFEDLELKRVAVVYQGEEWSELISSSFAKKFSELGGTVVFSEKTQLTDRDFRTVITRVKAAHVDGVYLPLNANANSFFLIQAKQLGLAATYMSGGGLIQDEIDAAGQAAENVYFTNAYTEETEKIAEKYRKKYNTDSGSPIYVSFGYDAVNVLLEAHKIAAEKNISVRDALTMVKMQGIGSYINMNGGQFSDRIERIYKIAHAKPVEVKK